MKPRIFLVCLSLIIAMVGCGITEEKDQTIELLNTLSTQLSNQETNYQDTSDLINEIPDAFEDDLLKRPDTGLFYKETGDLYANFVKRQELYDSMQDEQKQIVSSRKQLKSILSKNAVDVPNKQLKLLMQSLQLIEDNNKAFIVFIETGFDEEEELYNNLPSDDLSDQQYIINRNYGSATILSEEAMANITYAKSQIASILESTQSN